jgi:anti-sigma B factor antagonist
MHHPAAAFLAANSRPAGLDVRHRALDDRTCVLSVAGEIDVASAPVLKSALLEALAHGYRRFVIDLSAVDHMDSTGLGVLIGVRRRLEDERQIAITGARHNVQAVFKITGLDSRFEMFATVDAGIAHLTRGTGAVNARPALSTEAALVIGLASTALPFADSLEAEAERWLRILRLHGDPSSAGSGSGVATALAGADQAETDVRAELAGGTYSQRIEGVIEHACRVARDRAADVVATVDVLAGVLAVYGADFDRVLSAYGSDRKAVTQQLGG